MAPQIPSGPRAPSATEQEHEKRYIQRWLLVAKSPSVILWGKPSSFKTRIPNRGRSWSRVCLACTKASTDSDIDNIGHEYSRSLFQKKESMMNQALSDPQPGRKQWLGADWITVGGGGTEQEIMKQAAKFLAVRISPANKAYDWSDRPGGYVTRSLTNGLAAVHSSQSYNFKSSLWVWVSFIEQAPSSMILGSLLHWEWTGLRVHGVWMSSMPKNDDARDELRIVRW